MVTVPLTVLDCVIAHICVLQRSKESRVAAVLLEVLVVCLIACARGECGHEVIVRVRLRTHVC